MTQLRLLALCPFCDPPKRSRRLSRHVLWHHKDQIESGRVKLASDGRIYWNGGLKAVTSVKELDSMPKVMVEIKR